MYEGKVKNSSLAYNRSETRDPYRSWCHLHTSVKLFWSQPMAQWTSAAAYDCAAVQSINP